MRFAAKAAFVFILLAGIEYYPVALGKIPIPIYKVNAFSVYDSVSAGLERGLNGADIGDLVTQFYPWRDYAARSIRQGVILLWNPYILGGTPFEAAQSGIFYPLNIPFYILPVDWAWSFMIVSQLILAGVFAALYVRSIGAGSWGAILAGVVFAFCGFMTSWRGFQIEDAALWLPLILLCTDRLGEEPSLRRLAAIAAALSMPLLSGHPETAIHVYMVAGVYALFRLGSVRSVRFLTMFAIAVLLAIAVAAIQVVPTLEWIQHVPRSTREAWPGRPPSETVAVFSRDMTHHPNADNVHIPEGAAYAGILTLLLAVWAPFHRNRKLAIFWIVVVLWATAVVYEIPPLFQLFGKLPVVGGIKNSRLLLVTDFGLAVLAALGLSSASDDAMLLKQRMKRAAPLMVAAGLSILILQQLSRPLIPIAIVAAGGLMMSLRISRYLNGRAYAIGCVGLAAMDLVSAAHGFFPFANRREIFPAAPVFQFLQDHSKNFDSRVVAVNSAYAANSEMMYGLSTVGGVDVPLVRSRRFFFDYIEDNANGFNLLASRIRETQDRRLDLMAVKYLVTSNTEAASELERFPQRFVPVFSDGTTRVFENKAAMTRAIFVSADGVEVIPEEIPQLRQIADSHFDPARSVIMEDAPFHDLVQDVPTSGANSVSGFVQTPNEIRVDVNAVQRGVVVVSEILFPGWTAKIDGTPTKIIRADYALMGIPVERGSHSIVLTFSPLSYRIGAGVSIVSLILLVVATAFQRPAW